MHEVKDKIKHSEIARKGRQASPWGSWNPDWMNRGKMSLDQRAVVIKKIMKEKAQ